MKLPLLFCLALCLTNASCERQAELRREITVLESTFRKDEAATRQYEADIAVLGGRDAVSRIIEQTQLKQDQIRPLELVTPSRERKLSAIETELAQLKPAAEAFKAAQLK